MTKKKLNLSKFNKTSHGFLQTDEVETPEVKVVKSTPVKKEKSDKVAKKVGRPMTAEEPLTYKLSINLSENEIDKLKNEAGLVPLATYLRSLLRDKGII